jgi:hypothetical protein
MAIYSHTLRVRPKKNSSLDTAILPDPEADWWVTEGLLRWWGTTVVACEA